MMAAGYTMDLYCDNRPCQLAVRNGYPSVFMNQFYGQTFGECKKTAKKSGWMFRKDDTHVCPLCNTKNKKKTPASGTTITAL